MTEKKGITSESAADRGAFAAGGPEAGGVPDAGEEAASNAAETSPGPPPESEPERAGAGRSGARGGALALAFAAAALAGSGGYVAARGEPVPGAILYASGAGTSVLAAILLARAAFGRPLGFLFALATLATLGAVALVAALAVVGG